MMFGGVAQTTPSFFLKGTVRTFVRLDSFRPDSYHLGMNLPNMLTISRIVLAPIFFVFLFLPQWTGSSPAVFFVLSCILFLYIEFSDIVDGSIARRKGLVTEIGKLLDPFSDVLSRLTYFVAFVALGIMPAWIFLLLLYRELTITFMRMILFNRGIALAARGGGKLKAVLYAIAGVAGMSVLGVDVFGAQIEVVAAFKTVALIVFGCAVIVSLASLIDYIVVFLRHIGKRKDTMEG